MPPTPKKAPPKVEPKPPVQAPPDYIAPLSTRGRAVGRTLTKVSGRFGDELGSGLVELWNIEGHKLLDSTGYYVEARHPFSSPVDQGVLVVMAEGFLIESVMHPMTMNN